MTRDMTHQHLSATKNHYDGDPIVLPGPARHPTKATDRLGAKATDPHIIIRGIFLLNNLFK